MQCKIRRTKIFLGFKGPESRSGVQNGSVLDRGSLTILFSVIVMLRSQPSVDTLSVT